MKTKFLMGIKVVKVPQSKLYNIRSLENLIFKNKRERRAALKNKVSTLVGMIWSLLTRDNDTV